LNRLMGASCPAIFRQPVQELERTARDADTLLLSDAA
jgi:hypothetical protein